MREEDYEAFWNSPVMTSPEVEAYLDRVGEEAVSNYGTRATHIQQDIDQVVDPNVREYAHRHLEGVLDNAAEDNGRRLGVGRIYEDLDWKATCTAEPDRWLHSSRVKIRDT